MHRSTFFLIVGIIALLGVQAVAAESSFPSIQAITASSFTSAAPVSFGTTYTGTITQAGQYDPYTFSASVGDAILIRMSASWVSYPRIKVKMPDGTLLQENTVKLITANEILVVCPVSGTYTVEVGDWEGDSTGQYGVFIQRTNNPGNAVSLSSGQTIESTIGSLGQFQTYTITPAQNTDIFLRMSASWVSYPRIRIFNPSGTLLQENTEKLITTSELRPTCAMAGTYTVIAGDWEGDSTGTMGITALYRPGPGAPAIYATPIVYGSTNTGTISKRGQYDPYTFEAVANDRIFIRLSASWVSYPRIRVFNPSGTLLQENTVKLITTNELFVVCPVSGTYTVEVGDWEGDSTGQYGVFVQRTNNPGNAVYLSPGQTIDSTISSLGQFQTYTITPAQNTDIFLRMSASWVSYPRLKVFSPDGTLLQENTEKLITTSELRPTCSMAGTYTVLAGDWEGDSTGTMGITAQYNSAVLTPLAASFTASPLSGTVPLSVQFVDSSTGSPTSWSWNFGDGSTSTQQHPSHVYTSAGTYTARLTVSKAGVTSSTTTRTITVTGSSGGSLTASFIATPTSGTAPLTVQFIDASSGSPTSWSWSFGDGSTSTQQHPSHVYTSAGTYTARLTVSKAGVASSTTTQTITVSGSTTTAPWYVPHVLPATIQAEDYDNTGSGTAYYDTTAANEGGAYRSDGVDIERLSSGGYTVCYIREGEWTRYTVESPTTATYPVSFRVNRWLDPARTIDVYVDSGLQKTITVPKTTSSSVFTTVSTSLTIPAGRHTIMLKYHGGSMNLDSFTLGGSAPQPTGLIAAFSSTSTSGAAPLTVRFTDTSTGSPTSWSWSFGDGSTSTLQSPSHVYTTPGTYTVWLTVAKAGAGSSSATRTVTVTSGSSGRDLLFTSFNGPDTGIRGRTIAIDATIKNQGAQTASGFYVRYYLSSDATVTTGDRLLFTRYIGSLANGASSTTRAYVSIPSTVAVGTYYLGGIIDPTSRVSETNEGNNVKVDTGRLRIS